MALNFIGIPLMWFGFMPLSGHGMDIMVYLRKFVKLR